MEKFRQYWKPLFGIGFVVHQYLTEFHGSRNGPKFGPGRALSFWMFERIETTADSKRIHDVSNITIFMRQPVSDKFLALSGPSGAGKSTAVNTAAKQMSRGQISVDIDPGTPSREIEYQVP